MRVLLLNGSPREKGCTYTALAEVAKAINDEGIETTIFHIGNKAVQGCIDCRACKDSLRCIFNDDHVNEAITLLTKADGLVVGSPVYFAGPCGALCSFLDRMFYLKSHLYAYKPAAAVVNCRRGGASSAFDRLNKYFTISNMPVVSSQYWNSTHGTTVEEVLQDLEGLQTMRTLGRNMAWMLKGLTIAAEDIDLPKPEHPRQRTNFIR
ncbi:MAG: flavodoxin family protein [Clostridiales bacterium]